ncbi:hypothetical protein [Undibacterium sp.]|nr:hypothetical protein [Undibacterium sp.]
MTRRSGLEEHLQQEVLEFIHLISASQEAVAETKTDRSAASCGA